MRDQHVAPDRPATSALRRADRDARDAEPCAAEGDPQLTFFKAAFRDTEQGPGGHRGGHGPLLPARGDCPSSTLVTDGVAGCPE